MKVSSRRRRRRRTAARRLKNTLLYLLMRCGVLAMERLPVRGFIRGLGNLSPYIFRREAQCAQEQLRASLPDLDAAKTTRRMFVHFSQSLWELARLRRSVPRLDGAAKEVLDTALQRGNGAVLISGHIGNWEILAQAVAAAGYPVATVATPSFDPRITRWLDRWRSQRGLKIIWRRNSSAKAVVRLLRSNHLVGFLIDQDTDTAGDYVNFFGRPAFTPTSPAALALRMGAPVIFCWHHRRGKVHKITMEPIAYHPTGNLERDTLSLTGLLTARLEEVIRRAPEQWVWLHRRWRTLGEHPPLDSTR